MVALEEEEENGWEDGKDLVTPTAKGSTVALNSKETLNRLYWCEIEKHSLSQRRGLGAGRHSKYPKELEAYEVLLAILQEDEVKWKVARGPTRYVRVALLLQRAKMLPKTMKNNETKQVLLQTRRPNLRHSEDHC